MKTKAMIICLVMIVLVPALAQALERCKVAVDRNTGVIQVSAANVAGTPTWGDLQGLTTKTFPNIATCLDTARGTMKDCWLGANGTLQQILSPGRCVVYVDDGTLPCAAMVPDCTPERTPPGTVVAFTGPASAIPNGWLLADGSMVSRDIFKDLFASIGTSHGIGNGTTTFNLPDYRGRFLRGVDLGVGSDPDRDARGAMNAGGNTGNNVGSVQGDATDLPNSPFLMAAAGIHIHSIGPAGAHVHSGILRQGNAFGDANGSPRFAEPAITNTSGTHIHSMLSAGAHAHSLNAGGDAETRPVNAYVNWIIKY